MMRRLVETVRWPVREGDVSPAGVSTVRGSARLPAQSRQPPPAGAQVRADLGAVPLALKVENFCSRRGEPQCGHTEGSSPLFITSFSKSLPHFRQVYSKIGMVS